MSKIVNLSQQFNGLLHFLIKFISTVPTDGYFVTCLGLVTAFLTCIIVRYAYLSELHQSLSSRIGGHVVNWKCFNFPSVVIASYEGAEQTF